MISLSALSLLVLSPAAFAEDVPAPVADPQPDPAASAEVDAAAAAAAATTAAAAPVAAPVADVAPATAEPTLTTAPLQVAPVAAPVVHPAQELSPTDAELQRRFIDEAPTQAAPSLAGQTMGSGWMWPLGMLGLVGVAGLVLRQRQGASGVPSEVLVLSRTPISRTSSLAVIEVAGVDGAMRRLLIGVGGGAPRMVADLSVAGVTATVASTPEELAWMRGAAAPVAAPAEVEDTEEPVAPRRRRGAAAYAAEAAQAVVVPRKRREEREDLLAEVLAEREREAERNENKDTNWKDPWARNFEALLGPSGGTGR